MSCINDENAVGPLSEVVIAHIGGEIGVGASGYSVGDEFSSRTAAHGNAAYRKAVGRRCAPQYPGTARMLDACYKVGGSEGLGEDVIHM